MSAACRAGLIDRALLHDDYQLADELYDLAVKLGGGLLARHEGGLVGSHDRSCRSQIDPQRWGSGYSAR
jgi:hypothetical protein